VLVDDWVASMVVWWVVMKVGLLVEELVGQLVELMADLKVVM
jgi:hypothetical protein